MVNAVKRNTIGVDFSSRDNIQFGASELMPLLRYGIGQFLAWLVDVRRTAKPFQRVPVSERGRCEERSQGQ